MLPILPILIKGPWTIKMPVIEEIKVQGNRVDFDDENDPFVSRFLSRIRRGILIGLQTTPVSELGLGRGHEGLDSSDTYTGILVANNQNEAMSIFNNLREICIKIQPTEIYNRIEISNATHQQRKAKWIIPLDITAFRKGRLRVKN